ncbi:hypothetical protein TNCV_4984451 [Trichonephila clavipes]|nr:hypothetical protein TNCV_4984451 [Trichonephila clavipes]
MLASPPSGVVFSDADCCAVGPGRRAAKSSREAGGRRSARRPLTTSMVFSLKLEPEASQIVLSHAWCSKQRLTTSVHLALSHDEFREPRSDTVG